MTHNTQQHTTTPTQQHNNTQHTIHNTTTQQHNDKRGAKGKGEEKKHTHFSSEYEAS
jgi:hypothetical protein